MFDKKVLLPNAENALKGRDSEIIVSNQHYVHNRPIQAPFPDGVQVILLGLGCFWGAERKFWSIDGVYTTAVGYAGGFTKNPTYEEVCSGQTGHSEVVLVAYQTDKISLNQLLAVFFESHNPTQGMRQGNDQGTQYRSAIYYYTSEQASIIEAVHKTYQADLQQAGYSEITTEVKAAEHFYYAEEYHQQYLAKNPAGYCGLGGTGVSCNV